MPDTDPGSLDRLHDIVTPPPIPWWPPAPGWYVVGGLGLVLLGAVAWTWVAQWHRDRYRRAALKELNALAMQPANVLAIAELVKRVALVAYPRALVASLTGKPWLEYLDETGGGTRFVSGAGKLLETAPFRPSASIPQGEMDALVADVRYWIRHHRC